MDLTSVMVIHLFGRVISNSAISERACRAIYPAARVVILVIKSLLMDSKCLRDVWKLCFGLLTKFLSYYSSSDFLRLKVWNNVLQLLGYSAVKQSKYTG